MKTYKVVKWLDDILYSLIASQAYRGALRFPRISRRRGRAAPHHTAATYVRTHAYIGSGYPLHWQCFKKARYRQQRSFIVPILDINGSLFMANIVIYTFSHNKVIFP